MKEIANTYSGNDTTAVGTSGIYCGLCGAKTYLSKDGTHRRCPNCDDGR